VESSDAYEVASRYLFIMKIIVNDAFQKNYIYELVMPAG